uniref:Uncharacterized protein n=1 Tax=Rhizophora mucronata TaxID=61149 RepID=A0A2P2JX73_RHIMU
MHLTFKNLKKQQKESPRGKFDLKKHGKSVVV